MLNHVYYLKPNGSVTSLQILEDNRIKNLSLTFTSNLIAFEY